MFELCFSMNSIQLHVSFINVYQEYLQCVTQTAFRVWGKSAEMCRFYQNGYFDTHICRFLVKFFLLSC